MIIGPNGTGKSSIVCGIALGLGGSTQVYYFYFKFSYAYKCIFFFFHSLHFNLILNPFYFILLNNNFKMDLKDPWKSQGYIRFH